MSEREILELAAKAGMAGIATDIVTTHAELFEFARLLAEKLSKDHSGRSRNLEDNAMTPILRAKFTPGCPPRVFEQAPPPHTEGDLIGLLARVDFLLGLGRIAEARRIVRENLGLPV